MFRAWLELARLSNLPTVWTNGLVGAALGGLTDFARIAQVLGGVSLLYIAGMIGNDVADVAVDRERERGRTRPIPSGRVSRAAAASATFVMTLGGLACLLPLGAATAVWSIALALVIAGYDLLHHRWSPSIALMGLCRGLVYVVAAGGLAGDDAVLVGVVASGMTLYVIGLTVIARREHVTHERGARNAELLAVPLAVVGGTLGMLVQPAIWPAAVALGVATIGWLVWSTGYLRRQPPQPPRAIMGWLAGICLADATWAALFDRLDLAGLCAGCFVLTVLAHRRILGS